MCAAADRSTRETDLLAPDETVGAIHAITLSGGSAFGLDAAAGVMASLAERGIGFPVGNALVPIVPGAVLFDLNNGGDKNWGRFPPIAIFGHGGRQCGWPRFPARQGRRRRHRRHHGEPSGRAGSAPAPHVAASGHVVGAIVAGERLRRDQHR